MAPMSYCPECGNRLERHLVGGEERRHWFCRACGVPRHDHPLVVVTCFVACDQQLLWVQRELEPKRGLWAIPGGFLQQHTLEAMAAGGPFSMPACIVVEVRGGRIARLEDRRSSGDGELERYLRTPDRGLRRRAALAAPGRFPAISWLRT